MAKTSPHFKNLKPLGLIFGTALAFALSQLLASPTYAAEPGKTVWTNAEAKQLGEKYAAIVDAECHHDTDCERQKYAEYRAAGDPEGTIAGYFNQTPFFFTKLEPYKPKFGYYYNDLATGLENRDFDRPYLLYGAKKFDIIIIFDNSEKQYTFPSISITAREFANYSIGDVPLPKGYRAIGLVAKLEVLDTDSVSIRHSVYLTQGFQGCLDSPDYKQGMFCESYFDLNYGIRYRAVNEEDLAPEKLPELEPGPADHPQVESQQTFDSDPSRSQAPDYSSNPIPSEQGSAALAVAETDQLSETAVPNTSPLAPNTGQNFRERLKNLATTHPSRLLILASFVLLLIVSNSLIAIVHFAKKTSKKSRKTIDIPDKVR